MLTLISFYYLEELLFLFSFSTSPFLHPFPPKSLPFLIPSLPHPFPHSSPPSLISSLPLPFPPSSLPFFPPLLFFNRTLPHPLPKSSSFPSFTISLPSPFPSLPFLPTNPLPLLPFLPLSLLRHPSFSSPPYCPFSLYSPIPLLNPPPPFILSCGFK